MLQRLFEIYDVVYKTNENKNEIFSLLFNLSKDGNSLKLMIKWQNVDNS